MEPAAEQKLDMALRKNKKRDTNTQYRGVLATITPFRSKLLYGSEHANKNYKNVAMRPTVAK